jgi:tetratricopeptide (TPR) repeat protein
MPQKSLQTTVGLLLLTGCLFPRLSLAETGKILVQVQDKNHRPVKGAEIAIDGIGGSGVTGDDGKTALALGKDTKEGEWVSFTLLHSPPNSDLAIFSPYDYRAQVPPFVEKSENFVKIFVMQRGDKVALENGAVLAALTAKINKENAPQLASKSEQSEDPKAALAAVAKLYGVEPDELDKQIRVWGAKTTDPYDAGLAALYERNYPEASTQLHTSLTMREEKLAADQKMVAGDEKAVADASFFLGQSLYEQGKYKDSAAAFQKRLHLTPDDALVLNDLGLSLTEAGDYSQAETIYHRALAINEKTFGLDYPGVATNLNNLANLFMSRAQYAEAEIFYGRALAINEKALGQNDPAVATNLNNLAEATMNQGYGGEAEAFFNRALAIDEKVFGPESRYVATILNNRAGLLMNIGDLAEAEPLVRRALAIDEKALGPCHPDVAADLNNLASLLNRRGNFSEAEPLCNRALAIDEKMLGPNHPAVARELYNLAVIRSSRGNNAEVESLLRRALTIDEKSLGSDSPDVAWVLNRLAGISKDHGDYAEAELLYRRALAIDEKALQPNHPNRMTIQQNLNALIELEAKKKEK